MSAALNISTLFNVDGMVVVVTGGGTGLGLSVARALDANGAAAVYIVGRREDKLKEAAKQATNGKIIPLVGDVTSKDSLRAVAAQVKEKHGFVDVLFANSGAVGVDGSKTLPKDRTPSVKEFVDALWAPSMDDFNTPLQVNVTGVWFTALAFLELLDAGNKRNSRPQRSQILVTTSIAGSIRTHAMGYAYNVSKAAANHLVKMMATRFGDYKIRVNAVTPGMYPSEMTANVPWLKNTDPTIEGNVASNLVPLQRSGSEADIAGAALFLMSPAGAYIDGNLLVTDGGRMGQVPSTY